MGQCAVRQDIAFHSLCFTMQECVQKMQMEWQTVQTLNRLLLFHRFASCFLLKLYFVTVRGQARYSIPQLMFYNARMCLEDADGMANSADPEQTAPKTGSAMFA